MDECVVVGYALNSKKLRRSEALESLAADAPAVWRGGGLADILASTSAAISSGVRFELWDPSVAPSQQPHFDVLVHKLTEDLTSEGGGKIAALEAYLAANPRTKIVDPLGAVRRVVSREVTCRALDLIVGGGGGDVGGVRRQPRYFVYPSSDGLDFDLLMTEHGVEYPVICKPLVACGTPSSHQMVVVVSAGGLSQLSSAGGYLVQQFHNHDGRFYKVYVIDTDVEVFVRPSLPNLSPDLRSVEFDSRFAYPTLDDFCAVEQSDKAVAAAPPATAYSTSSSKLSREHKLYQSFHDVAMGIREEFGLTLFGFDVVIPSEPAAPEAGQLLVVDVNFFPSYKEVEDFPQRFLAYLRRTGLAR